MHELGPKNRAEVRQRERKVIWQQTYGQVQRSECRKLREARVWPRQKVGGKTGEEGKDKGI